MHSTQCQLQSLLQSCKPACGPSMLTGRHRKELLMLAASTEVLICCSAPPLLHDLAVSHCLSYCSKWQ